jgi:hypothetical protein
MIPPVSIIRIEMGKKTLRAGAMRFSPRHDNRITAAHAICYPPRQPSAMSSTPNISAAAPA